MRNSWKSIRQIFYNNQNKSRFNIKWYCYYSTKGYSYIHKIGSEPLRYKTIGDLVDLASEKYPTREAVIFSEVKKRLTFRQLKEQTDKLASGLLSLGLKKGDKLAIWSPNTLEWYLGFFGAAKIGIVTVLLNPMYTYPELEYCLKKAKVTSILAPEYFRTHKYYDMIKKFNSNQKSSNQLRNIIISSEKLQPDSIHWEEIFSLGKTIDSDFLEAQKKIVDPSDILTIGFTSGTTGHAKAVSIANFNFVNNSYQISRRHQLYEKQHRFCLQTPFFHGYATAICMCPALHSGSTLVVPSKSYNPIKTLETIQNEKCTFVNGTPTMYVDLVKVQKERKFDLSSLIFAVSGGAPCPPVLFRDMLNTLNVRTVKSVYGLTETTGVIFQSLPNEDKHYATETVGHIQDHIEAKVVNSEGQLVPFGTSGELYVRGYCVMQEYLNDKEKTREILGLDGWLRTGDQFVLYENGYGKIVGRIKDMIIRGGENIFPKEIEDFLNTHPNILDSQVFGVEDERLGEEVAVCIRPNNNSKISLYDIEQFCEGKLAKYKVPKYLYVLNEFPTTTSGKIQKHKLKEMYTTENK